MTSQPPPPPTLQRLASAVEAGDEEAVLAALQEGADCEYLCPPDDPDSHGGTLLMKAVVKGHAHLIPVLTGAGVDVNGRGNVGYTPLHAAAVYGGSWMIPLLAKAGADINCMSSGGFGEQIEPRPRSYILGRGLSVLDPGLFCSSPLHPLCFSTAWWVRQSNASH